MLRTGLRVKDECQLANELTPQYDLIHVALRKLNGMDAKPLNLESHARGKQV